MYRQADETPDENSYEELAKVDIDKAANEGKWSAEADEQTLNQTCRTWRPVKGAFKEYGHHCHSPLIWLTNRDSPAVDQLLAFVDNLVISGRQCEKQKKGLIGSSLQNKVSLKKIANIATVEYPVKYFTLIAISSISETYPVEAKCPIHR